MTTIRNIRTAVLALAAAAWTLTGCTQEKPSTGAVRGKVVNAQGSPTIGVRVAIDGPDGLAGMTNSRGEFRIGGVEAGRHAIYALHTPTLMSGAADADVGEGETEDAGVVVLSNSCEAEPPPEEEPPPEGEPDPSVPCDWPPPPLPEQIHFDLLVADTAEAAIDPWGIYGWFSDDGLGNQVVSVDFWAPGDFTAGGDFAEHLVNDPANDLYASAHIGLNVQDVYGYYYVLREGDLTISVYDDGDGDDTTAAFSFLGENLVFDYLECTGDLLPDYNATVTAAQADGPASVHLPPAPPEADITVETFVANYVEMGVHPGDAAAGTEDMLYAWAVDETNGVSLALAAPVSALSNAPTALTFEVMWGWSSYYVGTDSWYPTWDYYFNQGTVTLSDAVVVGSELTLTLENAELDFAPIIEPDPANPLDLNLFIGTAALTSEVLQYDWTGEGGGGCNCPPPPGS